MKVFYLLPDFILPTKSGLHVRELSQLRLLSEIEIVDEVTIATLSPTGIPAEHIRELEQMIPKVVVLPPVVQPRHIRSSPKAFLNFVQRRIFDNEPYLPATYNVPRMNRLIERQLLENDYDIIYISYLGMMVYIDTIRRYSPKSHVVLEQHNMEWQIFDRLADQSPWWLRKLIRFEAQALKRYEESAMRDVDVVISISETDASLIHDISGVSPIVVPTYFENQTHRDTNPESMKIGYIGHLKWQPNVIGLDWFFKEVWHRVRARIPNAELIVAGPGLSRSSSGELEVPQLWQNSGVEIVGFVDDLNDLYSQVVGMIAPVIGGSGVRMKLLETMGAGMPTVTTPDGALGLLVTNGTELLIQDDPESFASDVVRILTDRQLREQLRNSGYDFLERHHSIAVAKKCMETAITKHF